MITVCAALIGVPVGVLGGTFLAEYARGRKIARIISILSDIMVSVPSIVHRDVHLRDTCKAFGALQRMGRSNCACDHHGPCCTEDHGRHAHSCPVDVEGGGLRARCAYYKVIIQVVYRGGLNRHPHGILLSIARVAGETARFCLRLLIIHFFRPI